jgi:Na(+)-translocating NADH:ubiquinone oxidoreductase F subunit
VTEAKKHSLALTESIFVSPYIKELRFKVIGEPALSFKAGAFMRFFIPAAKGVSVPLDLPQAFKPHWQHIEPLTFEHSACTRSYSFATSSRVNDELVFTIKIQTAPNNTVLPGVGSSYLCNLAVGATIEVLGPFEDFFAQSDSQKTMVMLGAGSGMAPLKSIIEDQMALIHENSHLNASSETEQRNIHFFYGARTENDLLYVGEFYQLAEQNEHFHYYPTLSQTNENWLGATGYVQEVLALNFEHLTAHGELSNVEFYLCGPEGLMSETIALLKEKGVDESAIFFDEFS